MYKVKKEYIGLVLKGGGVSILLNEDTNQSKLEFVRTRFGEKYTTKIRVKKIKDDIEDDKDKKNE